MPEFNLLFLSPNWRVSLIQAFQSTKKKLGFPGKLVGVDSDVFSPTKSILDKSHVTSKYSSDICLDEILDVCRLENIHAVIPMINLAVEFLDWNRSAFEKLNIKLVLNDSNTVEVCHDKLNLAQFCGREGIDVPEVLRTFDGGFGYPLIAKQRRGEGGKEIIRIEDRRDLDYCREKFPDHLIQRYMNGQEFSIDWYSDFKGCPVYVIPRERLTVRAGEVMVSRICMHPAIMEAAKKLGERLALKGPCNLQGFLEGNRFYFTDVNLRFGSGSIHSIAAGANIPEWMFQEFRGESFSEVKPVIDGNIMSRYPGSFFE